MGFANCNIGGKIFISKEQLKRILNSDENCLALGGRKSQQEGRPAVIFYHSKLPQTIKATNKTSTIITIIGGITAAG